MAIALPDSEHKMDHFEINFVKIVLLIDVPFVTKSFSSDQKLNKLRHSSRDML